MADKLMELNSFAVTYSAINAIIIFAVTFLVSAVFLKFLIPGLRALKADQPINVYVPEHAGKAGTPSLGGLGFIFPILVVMLVRSLLTFVPGLEMGDLLPMAFTLILGMGCALIGFVDDYAKLRKKENQGLTSWQKLLLQIVISGAYLAAMGISGNLETALRIPFTSFSLELGWFAYPLYLLVIVGFENSTNITDGLDGLASSVGTLVGCMAMYMCVCFASAAGSALSASLVGGLLAFLIFNRYPAKVFMGDTGSLFIGGILMGIAISEGELICVIIAAFAYVAEMLSSLLQILYFKVTHGKRLFRRAPVHHHFQLKGWTEVKVVDLFFFVTLALCIVGFAGAIVAF